MPTTEPCLDAADAATVVREAFAPNPNRRVGVELEWLVVVADEPTCPVPFDRLRAAVESVSPLPDGGVVTYEPGGQLELSSGPETLPRALGTLAHDAAVLHGALDAAGLAAVGLGLDPLRPRRRVVDSPRYAAMEAYFDDGGPAGRSMMCGTAAIQINLDTGAPHEIETRWNRVHGIGPLLLAAFANSPLVDGRPSGWRSSRWAVWDAIDPCRTAAVTHTPEDSPDAAGAWTRYALDARVMLINSGPEHAVPVLEPMSFAEWIRDGHELGWPTHADLTYHLSTLFPPVRPRGRFELRMIDALPDDCWPVAVAVATALVDDPIAAEVADAVAPGVFDRWSEAARDGLHDAHLRTAARACFAAVVPALGRMGVSPATVRGVEEYAARYVEAGRTPADDRLDSWTRHGHVLAPELVGTSS